MSKTAQRERYEAGLPLRLCAAVAAVVLAHVGDRFIPNGLFPGPLFVAAIMIAIQVGGSGAGILAFVLSSALLDYYFLPPFRTFAIRADVLPSLAQVLVPTVLGWWFILRRKAVEHLLERETAVARSLQGDLSFEELGRSLLSYLAPELGASVAALYVIEDDGSARRCASFAFDIELAPPTIAAGSGLVGQAAADCQLHTLDAPGGYLTVASSLGQARPSRVVVSPASDGTRARAVLELGFFGRVERASLDLLERISEPLAIAVRTAGYRAQLHALLEETRRQAEELKAHEDELRTTNEELEERGRAMTEAQAELEGQQAELEETNRTLGLQTRQLEEQHDELAHAHENVRIKSEAAERASTAKSAFLANMSHELRTPLNSSLILSKLLSENKEGNLSEQQVRSAETIYSAGNDLLAMIDDILDLAKIEAGKLDLRMAELTLSRLRDDMQRTFESLAVERNLHFSTTIADGTPVTISTDAQRLAQILKNLLSNALKFTEQGAVSLTISGDEKCCRFAVTDTGIGIPEAQLGQIFEAFRQVDGNPTRKYGGTGLGLSISRELATLLNGEIAVSSSPGKGSTFTLRVPTVLEAKPKTAEPEQARALNALKAKPAAVSDDGVRTILIVEDDLRFAQIVADLVTEMGFSAKLAATAEEAIEYAVARPPKGIVLDMKLPDHSGLSVLDRLKREPRTRHVPVHVISFSDNTRTALEMGAVGYLLKPAEREQVKQALRKLELESIPRVRRLLVVEDDLTQREAICQLIRSENVEIVAVGTVKEALDQLRTTALDCVVTDLTLPDASGFDLLETMAKDERYSFPSVVVYTGRSLSAEDEQRLRQYSSSIIVKGARSPERLLDEVTLFLHQVESALPPERQRMLLRARNREAIFEDRHVLVVEDDVRNVFALTSALEPKGMNVRIARNGREALEALEQGPCFDVVLMDIMMPEMDGLEATRAIRSQPKWHNLPIIALTAKAMQDDRERCMQAGASDYIPKPLDVDMLLSLLRIWMHR